MGIEDIVNKILTDGEKLSQQIVSNAEQEKERIISEITNEGEKLEMDMFRDGQRKIDFDTQQNIINEKVKLRSKILEEKNKILDDIYKKFEDEIYNLDKTEYKKFVKNMILKHSDGGEEIIVGELDKGLLDVNFIDDINKRFASENKSALIYVHKETVPLVRGVILRKDNIEKNLLLPTIFKYIKETTLPEVNKILFSEIDDEIGKFFF